MAQGFLALYFVFATSGKALVDGVLIFGVIYALILVAVLVSPSFFGLFNPIPANVGDHVLHAALAVVSFGVWHMAKNEPVAQTAR